MRLSLLTAGAASALLLFQVPVMAQSNTNQHNGGATAEQSVNPTTGSSSAAGMSAHGSIRTQLQTMLQNQGYSDVRVMPSSFLVRAKDKEGSPVVMSVSPDSITEVAEVGSQRADPEASANSSSNSSAGQFVAIPNTDELSSNVVDSTSTTTTTRMSARSKTSPGTSMTTRRPTSCPSAASWASALTTSRSTPRTLKSAITTPTKSGTRQ